MCRRRMLFPNRKLLFRGRFFGNGCGCNQSNCGVNYAPSAKRVVRGYNSYSQSSGGCQNGMCSTGGCQTGQCR